MRGLSLDTFLQCQKGRAEPALLRANCLRNVRKWAQYQHRCSTVLMHGLFPWVSNGPLQNVNRLSLKRLSKEFVFFHIWVQRRQKKSFLIKTPKEGWKSARRDRQPFSSCSFSTLYLCRQGSEWVPYLSISSYG